MMSYDVFRRHVVMTNDDTPSIILTMLNVHHAGCEVHIVRLLRAREREMGGVGSHDNRTYEDILVFLLKIFLRDIILHHMRSHDVILKYNTFTSCHQEPLVTEEYFPGDGEAPDQSMQSRCSGSCNMSVIRRTGHLI